MSFNVTVLLANIVKNATKFEHNVHHTVMAEIAQEF